MADITTKYKSQFTGAEIDEGIEKIRNLTPEDIGAIAASRLFVNNTNILTWAVSQTAPTKALCDISVTDMPTTGGYWMIDLEYAPQGVWYQLIVTNIFTLAKYENIWNNGTWSGWHTVGNSLPLDGSKTMTGSLNIEMNSRVASLNFYDKDVSLWNYNSDWSEHSRIWLREPNATPADKAHVSGYTAAGGWFDYNILHTGNKPSGSYTGNGSAASRTIDTGGIGNTIRVGCSSGFLIVTPTGAIGYDATSNSVVAIGSGEATFYGGVLTTKTTHKLLNASGATYSYENL